MDDKIRLQLLNVSALSLKEIFLWEVQTFSLPTVQVESSSALLTNVYPWSFDPAVMIAVSLKSSSPKR